jgi:hypothetical protein
MLRDCSATHPENILGRPTDAVRRSVWAVVPDNLRASVPGLATAFTGGRYATERDRPVERKEVGSVALIIIIPIRSSY